MTTDLASNTSISNALGIVAGAKGVENTVAARELNENKQTVGKWPNRWAKAAIQFEKIQLGHERKKTETVTLKKETEKKPRQKKPRQSL